MFEQAFKNIEDALHKEAGCTTELDYTEQTSWLLFLKYLDGLEQDLADEAALNGKKYSYNIMKDTRKIDFADTFMVPRSYYDGLNENKKPRKRDLLYTVTGSFGIPVIVEDDIAFCFQRHIGLIRPKPEIDSSWLYYLLLSPQVMRQATERATGTAQKTVSLKVLRSLLVPAAAKPVQRAAASRLDGLTEETQRLECLYQRKLAALDELKKSLLHQAFTGQL